MNHENGLRQELCEFRKGGGREVDAASSIGSGTSASSAEWVLKCMLIRGWSPYSPYQEKMIDSV